MYSSSIAVLSVILLIFLFIKFHHRNTEALQQAIVVNVAKVKVGDIPVQAKAVGTLSAAKSIQVTPEFSGQVASVLPVSRRFDGEPVGHP